MRIYNEKWRRCLHGSVMCVLAALIVSISFFGGGVQMVLRKVAIMQYLAVRYTCQRSSK